VQPTHALTHLQLRQLEEKSRADLSILEDMQEFARARAKLELDHALSVQVSEPPT
jgi:hypothetical protein